MSKSSENLIPLKFGRGYFRYSDVGKPKGEGKGVCAVTFKNGKLSP